MNNTLKKRIGFALLITLITGIAYGISIPQLSFYGDDWIYIYNYHIAGSESFTQFTRWDRPFSAWIYVLTSALFGESPLFYHIYVFLMRWLSVFLFREILAAAFGEHKCVDAAALFFAVYPGFQQQPIAVEYVMHFTSLVLVLLSIRLMQKAFFMSLKKGWPLLVLGTAASLAAIFTCEYFVGLELARPFFLFFTARKGKEKNNSIFRKKFFLFMLPFAAVTAAFFIWRIFIFSFQTYQPKLLNALRENLISGMLTLVKKVLQDLLTVLGKAWMLILSRPSVNIPAALAILLSVSIGVFIFLGREHNGEDPDRRNSAESEMLLTGIALMLLSGIPFWGTFLDVSVSFPWDRSTLSFSPAAAMITAVLLSLIMKNIPFCAAAAVITAAAALFHLQNAQVYISEGRKLNDYFWQMSWRIPSLEAGTIIASDEIPLDRLSDNDISPVLNWQYAPENRGLAYTYKYFDLDLREDPYYSDPAVPVTVDHTYRTHTFRSSTEKTLAVFYRKNGCLQIIDGQNKSYPGLPDSLRRITRISDPELILFDTGAQAVPPAATGPEPERTYCYYFQKTAAALQQKDPGTALKYASEARDLDLHPVYASDLAPVTFAFINAGDLAGAEMMLSGSQIGETDREYLCSYWTYALPPESSGEELLDFYKSHGCL